jgi:hypothetical protein
MTVVTFIYNSNGIKMAGKFIGDIPDDYENGLDLYILNRMLPYFIDEYDDYNISIGIVGIMSNLYYFSHNEKNVFDILYIENVNASPTVYIHGNLIEV